ncbi:MAG: acyl-CoA dehydrogenase family protein [Nitrospirae bacterium]|nr:acyl-CoA dehydrogenase family protein [Nitrospirota bacterium]
MTGEQREIRGHVRQIAQKEIAPRAAKTDATGSFPRENMDLLARLGLLGLAMPKENGGSGEGALSFCLAIEEIAKACASTATAYATQTHCAYPIMMAGSEEQRQRWLPALATGEKIGAIAFTEPQAGSDIGAMAATAERRSGEYLLNGRKMFITNGTEAGIFVVFASTDKAAGKKGFTAFVVEGGTRGLHAGPAEDKMGIRGSVTCSLEFQDCVVPEDHRLGNEGDGFALAFRFFDRSRPGIGALSVGIAQAALDYAAAYALERKQFGRPIADFQAIQFLLADMATSIAASRLLVYHAAMQTDRGSDGSRSGASMAKLFASDTAMRVTTDAVQILGGYGYSKEYPVERYMRDAKVTQIFEGTNQIQRLVIARSLLAGATGGVSQ